MENAGGAVARFLFAKHFAGMGWWWCWPARATMAAMGWSRRAHLAANGPQGAGALLVALLGEAAGVM